MLLNRVSMCAPLAVTIYAGRVPEPGTGAIRSPLALAHMSRSRLRILIEMSASGKQICDTAVIYSVHPVNQILYDQTSSSTRTTKTASKPLFLSAMTSSVIRVEMGTCMSGFFPLGPTLMQLRVSDGNDREGGGMTL